GRWLRGRSTAGPRWTRPRAPVEAPPVRLQSHRRWLGWLIVGVLAMLFGGLAVASVRAPVVSAAGNPLYLHGTSPGCVASTLDQTAGTQAPPCQVQSGTGVVTTWSFSSLPAQTVAAGTWTFKMYWTGGTGNTNDTVSSAVGV